MVDSEITEQIIGAAIAVHRMFGPGLLEGVYEECTSIELEARGLACLRQVKAPIVYKGRRIASDLKLDLLVENLVIVELKAVDARLPVHEAQLLTYLRLTDRRLGLLINFNLPVLRHGIKRMINNPVDVEAVGAE